jgi:hypothetical protein
MAEMPLSILNMEAGMINKRFIIGDDLSLFIGRSKVNLTPSQGLAAAEELARKSFRAALTEEARSTSGRRVKPKPIVQR